MNITLPSQHKANNDICMAVGKGDAYIHIPRTSTVASSLTISFGNLQDFQVSKTRRLKTPFFNMS